jgi:hypothetical protein
LETIPGWYLGRENGVGQTDRKNLVERKGFDLFQLGETFSVGVNLT